MRVSLITVCLNSEATIVDTINSVSSQDYPNIEHIVFDGGSTDKTLEVLNSFGDKIVLIKGTDKGIFDAMNQAISNATGDIIGIINSDDFYPNSNIISTVISAFKKYNTDSVYGDLQYVNRLNTNKISRNWKSGRFSRRRFKYGWTIPHPTFFVRKEIYERYGVFNKHFLISGDYELILRLLYKFGISTAYIPHVLVKMRSGGNSDGNLLKRLQSLLEDYKAWKINNLQPSLYTIPLKPIRKIPQLLSAKEWFK